MEWIDLATIYGESHLAAAIGNLSNADRLHVKSGILALLGVSEEEVESSVLRVLIERARSSALPASLWTRSLSDQSSIDQQSQRHLESLGLQVSRQRLDAMRRLYATFVDNDRKAKPRITDEQLEKIGYRCEHCGLAFCNEDLPAHLLQDSPHGFRPPLKVDPFKPHWSSDDFRKPTIDHDWPLSTFGDNSKDNLKVLCHGCNAGKGNVLSLEHLPGWSGLLQRPYLTHNRVDPVLFYTQVRRHPICASTGKSAAQVELTVRLRNAAGAVALDNLVTVESPGI